MQRNQRFDFQPSQFFEYLPVVVECPRPVISQELLEPAEHEAMDRLRAFLETLPPSSTGTDTDTTH